MFSGFRAQTQKKIQHVQRVRFWIVDCRYDEVIHENDLFVGWISHEMEVEEEVKNMAYLQSQCIRREPQKRNHVRQLQRSNWIKSKGVHKSRIDIVNIIESF